MNRKFLFFLALFVAVVVPGKAADSITGTDGTDNGTSQTYYYTSKTKKDTTITGVDSVFTITLTNLSNAENKTTSAVNYYTGDFIIPEAIYVTWNGDDNNSTKSVYIVTKIGGYCFYDCTKLTSVTIPSTVTSMNMNYTFRGCTSLAKINYTKIGNITSISGSSSSYLYTFSRCSVLTNVELPPATTSSFTGERAFYNCVKLETCTIPKNIDLTGSQVFYNCSSLKTIVFEEGNVTTSLDKQWLDGCTSVETVKNFPSGITELLDGKESTSQSYGAFYGCSSLKDIDLSNVTSIGSYAFYGCSSLPSSSFGESDPLSKVTSIGDCAFYNCTALDTIKLSSSLTTWGSNTFTGCTGLTTAKVETGESITTLPTYTFSGCTSLNTVTLPSYITELGTYAFNSCSALTDINFLPESLTTVGERAFASCTSVTSVTMPSTVTSLGKSAFNGCTALTDVTSIEKLKLTEIPESLFFECTSLTSFAMPSTVTTVGGSSFYHCTALTTVSGMKNLAITTIPGNLFEDCSSMTVIEVPATVDTIGDKAFWGAHDSSNGCYVKLYRETPPKLGNQVFTGNSSTKQYICVLPYALANYKEANGFSSDAYVARMRPFVDRTISASAGAATLALPYEASIPSNVEVYTLNFSGGTTCTATAVNSTLTRDTPVYIKGSGDVCFYGTSNEAVTSMYKQEDGNDTEDYYTPVKYALKGVYATDGQYAPKDSYVLQNQSGKGLAFYRVTSDNSITVGQFKAYLEAETTETSETSTAISIVFDEGDEETGIAGVSTEASTTTTGSAVYNLQGVRVSDSTESLPKGIYIRGGKKFVVK